jgi:hypothetical protein
MISVIKLRRVVGLADLHGVNVLAFISCVLSCGLNIAILARFGFDICMIQLWVWMDSVSLGIVMFSCCHAYNCSLGCLLYCAPSSGEIWDQLCGLDLIGLLH